MVHIERARGLIHRIRPGLTLQSLPPQHWLSKPPYRRKRLPPQHRFLLRHPRRHPAAPARPGTAAAEGADASGFHVALIPLSLACASASRSRARACTGRARCYAPTPGSPTTKSVTEICQCFGRNTTKEALDIRSCARALRHAFSSAFSFDMSAPHLLLGAYHPA